VSPTDEDMESAPARRRRGPIRVLVAAILAAVLLVLAGVGALAFRRTNDDDATRATTTQPTTTTTAQETTTSAAASTTTVAPNALTALLPELQAFVEQARGLKFKTPVEFKLLGDADFRKRLQELQEEDRDPEEIEDTRGVLVALGLLDKNVDLQAAIDKLLGGAVAGFYDPETDELVVRGSDATISVQSTMVHELVHALQDQHFNLDRDELDDRDDEQGQSFSGLVEGDAVHVEDQWLATRTAAERRQARAEESAQVRDLDDIPEVLFTLLSFPYATGPDLVERIRSTGGQRRLDEAFSAPPTTSEHLLHPEKYLAGEAGVTVAPPQADGEVYDEGVLGELGLLLMLAEELDQRAAARAAAGWGGDWYVAWRQGDQSCVRTDIVMDSPAHASELSDALSQWAARRQGATVSGNGPFTVTACG
jgi:hypothetical protein